MNSFSGGFKLTNYTRKGFFFHTYKVTIFKYSAGSPRIDALTEETMPGKEVYIYASVVSSKTILKLALKFNHYITAMDDIFRSSALRTRTPLIF